MLLKKKQSVLSIIADDQALSEQELDMVSGGVLPAEFSRPDGIDPANIDPVTGKPYGTGVQPIKPPTTNETRKQPPPGSIGMGMNFSN
jgi:hypothetical protein